MAHNHICGLYYLVPCLPGRWPHTPDRKYLPQVSLSVHARIIASTSRTTLTQTFVNPSKAKEISELRYTFPLYDGVSVVGFVCTINRDRVIRGVVKERAEARQTYQAAVARGETAGLLEQLPEASDVFTTTIGNVPAGAEIKVDITYLGELKHDAETDGIRFTIPTSIAPRYGSYPGEVLHATGVDTKAGINIVVDAEMPDGSNIKSVQSPSHPISVTIGNTSGGAASGADMSLQKASATLSLGTAELGQDFVLHVVATNTADPIAVLESHPTLPNHRALMATLVPKFNLPSSKPEIVFLCDRSGSMGGGVRVPNMKTALHIFLKSLPVGVKFNIVSFGSSYDFLFKNGSRTYDASSLKEAEAYVDKFDANFGGTEIYRPMQEIFKKRFTDMELEVFLLTDGEIWDQQSLFTMINQNIGESKGAIRVFTLGIGSDVSHALIEGVARAGNGFSQSVGDNEKMNSKVVRMLKASLTPHVKDYKLEVKYGHQDASKTEDDDFEIIEKVTDALSLDRPEPKPETKKPISLFDASANPDVEMADPSLDRSAGGKYSHVPAVAEPKLLQAPFDIPPLFPFNRTSVYLLMSPESVSKTPKSVILRGTSRYGPLELEIPVTVLVDKSETIHQLAAKKAVQELEEGRGWLHHAKDAKDPENKLLKDKFQGLFSDMVEREAVRLGVTYQVGGKWCSFVAVDESKVKANRDKAGEKSAEKEMVAPPPPAYAECAQYASSDDDVGFGLFDDGGPSPTMSAPQVQSARVSAAPPISRMMKASVASVAYRSAAPPPPPPPAPAPLPSPGSAFGTHSSQSFVAPLNRTRYRDDFSGNKLNPNSVEFRPCPFSPAFMPAGLSRSSSSGEVISVVGYPEPADSLTSGFTQLAAAPLPAAAPVRSGPSVFSKAKAMFGGSRGGGGLGGSGPGASYMRDTSASRTRHKKLSRSDSNDGGSLASHRKGGRSTAQESCDEELSLPDDKLEAIVALQTFMGSWAWDERLLALLGLDHDSLAAKVSSQLDGAFSVGSQVLATALVLAFLEAKLAGRKDEWEMLADKSRDWLDEELKAQAVGMSGEEYVDRVKGAS